MVSTALTSISCPHISGYGAYCVTGVFLSVCLSVCPSVCQNWTRKLNIFSLFLYYLNYSAHIWFEVPLIDTHLLMTRSRSSVKVKVIYQGYISQNLLVHESILFCVHSISNCFHTIDYSQHVEVLFHHTFSATLVKYISSIWCQQHYLQFYASASIDMGHIVLLMSFCLSVCLSVYLRELDQKTQHFLIIPILFYVTLLIFGLEYL